MTKRFGNFAENGSKKLKTNENLNDLWGDDLDAKDVDDCFLLATQVWEQDNFSCTQRNNVSILPPYNIFKQTSSRFTSTQSDPELCGNFPSTSRTPFTNGLQKHISIQKESFRIQDKGFKRTRSFDSPEPPQLDLKFKKLQEQYVAKEGEVSILRTQLKDIKTTTESEQTKQQKEWAEKFSLVSKQLGATKSELEFKNLEIANLKQKVVEVAKLNSLDTTLNSSQSPFFKQLRVPEKYTNSSEAVISTASNQKETSFRKGFKIQPVMETQIPLQHRIPANIFTFPREEKYMVHVKNKQMCRNTIPFLQNQMSQELIKQLIRLQPKYTSLDHNRRLDFDYIYCDISKLLKCNLQGIESEESNACINKILCVSEELITNLYTFLQQLEQNTQVENSQKVGMMYLESKFEAVHLNKSIFDTKEWCDDEMGISAKQSIACISEILPYSSYLRGYLLHNKSLIFNGTEEYLKYLPSVGPKLEKDYANNFSYLQLITSVVAVIRKLKKSDNFPGFLSAIAVLLNKICLNININDIHPIYQIIREITFSRPTSQTLFYLTEFLKNASLQNIFVNKLCMMPSKTTVLKINQKERILYYNQDACILQVLCILLEDSILKVDTLKIVDLYFNITQFVSNSIKCNPQWLFYQEDKHCDCLCKIVKLHVDVMYKTIEKFHKNQITFANEIQRHSKVLRSGLQTLHMLYFKVYDLIVKYVATYSQYKDVVKSMLSLYRVLDLTEYEVELLEDLNVMEDLPTLECKKFSHIPLWN